MCLQILRNNFSQFIDDMKQTVANKRQENRQNFDEGKMLMSFEVYCLVYDLIICGSRD